MKQELVVRMVVAVLILLIFGWVVQELMTDLTRLQAYVLGIIVMTFATILFWLTRPLH